VSESGLENQQLAGIHSVARIGLAVVFAYHGLVPKLLTRHADEIAMLKDSGVSLEWLGVVLIAFGLTELLFAVSLLIFWHNRWPLLLCLGFLCIGTLAVAVKSPRYVGAAFNPITLNLAVGCLALVDLLVLKGARATDPTTREGCG